MRRYVVPLLVGFLAALGASGARADFGPSQGVADPGATLATVLARGATTSGTSLTVSAGDSLLFGSISTITTDAWTRDIGYGEQAGDGVLLSVGGEPLALFGRDDDGPGYDRTITFPDETIFAWTASTSSAKADHLASMGSYAGDWYLAAPKIQLFEGSAISPTERVRIDGGALQLLNSTHIEGTEQTDVDAPAANKGVIYFRDNGGKTELVARFPTGAIQQIAIEP